VEQVGVGLANRVTIAHLAQFGAVHMDVVHVGVFLKRMRKLAEIRPKATGISLEVMLPQRSRITGLRGGSSFLHRESCM
jgi:hypothetical protein